MERSFKIGEREFQLSKINAMKQFHVVRRVAPILADMVPIMSEVSKIESTKKNLSEAEKFDQFAKLAAPLMSGISKLSDKDSELVLYSLLQAVEMKQQPTGNWARVATESGIMFMDLELPVLLQAAGRAFMYNMTGFFSALPQVS